MKRRDFFFVFRSFYRNKRDGARFDPQLVPIFALVVISGIGSSLPCGKHTFKNRPRQMNNPVAPSPTNNTYIVLRHRDYTPSYRMGPRMPGTPPSTTSESSQSSKSEEDVEMVDVPEADWSPIVVKL